MNKFTNKINAENFMKMEIGAANNAKFVPVPKNAKLVEKQERE